MKQVPIGQLMLQMGYITESQLEEALAYQKENPGNRLGKILIQLGMITETDKLEVLSKRFDIPVYRKDEIVVSREIAQLVPESIAQKYRIMPIMIKDNALVVAINDPIDLNAFEDIRANCGIPVELILAPEDMIEDAISTNYASLNVQTALKELQDAYEKDVKEDKTSEVVEERVDQAPVVKFINNLIKQAYETGASDIHIEPFEKKTLVRLRIDGVLQEFTTLDKKAHDGLITRLKIMSGMNIAEKRMPQDGRIDLPVSGRTLDIRLSSLPTIYGEKMVIRLLGHSLQKLNELSDLGLDAHNYEVLKNMIKNPYGVILVSGPTGSGKTTSLYAVLHEVMRPEINIVTVEDPVERKVEGINQVQVNTKAGLTFATGLRSILRQDPDVIMIGEIRDSETAEIAISSAITGHLVLSTIHTNDTATSINRLVDMGIEPFLVSGAVVGIVAQRLVRRVCP
ncbi:MAG: Flp pilus assembly complex ATPase component TadA, partial [Erysipelotrichaceae bacterium]|nr:Flp pilus assembly complex ATPase component TadA [Erysipelotrichaceae bacterium]